MPVRVVPTLAAMADIHRLPREERFDAYAALGRLGLPVAGYNPMTSKDVLGTCSKGRNEMVAFLYGDDAAAALGFTPVGLGPRVGERHAVWLAHQYRQRA
jgi:hypothetical protein